MPETDAATLPPIDEGIVSREAMMARLEELILSGQWRPGQKLPSERELVGHFRMSRPIVREVLRGLEERGYVTVLPARGSFVRALDASEVARPLDMLYRRTGVTARQLVVARSMLECEAASLAARNATAKDRRHMREVLKTLEAVDDLEHRAQLDIAFHEAIARSSGNPVLHIMFGSIRNLIFGLVLRSLSDREVKRAGEPLHGLVLEAINARDSEAARAAMHEHLTLAYQFYGKDLDEPLGTMLARRAASTSQVADVLAKRGGLSLPGSGAAERRRRR